jgi:hypothetical protein
MIKPFAKQKQTNMDYEPCRITDLPGKRCQRT